MYQKNVIILCFSCLSPLVVVILGGSSEVLLLFLMLGVCTGVSLSMESRIRQQVPAERSI